MKRLDVILIFFVFGSLLAARGEHWCFPKKFESSTVCSCNSTHCGDIGRIEIESEQVVVYQSSKDGLRFERKVISFDNEAAEVDLKITLLNETLQEIIGFGGAFTDAAGINWASLRTTELQNQLINAFYGENGLEYNMGRIPMAGCDFSTRDYTYDDTVDDFELNDFALAKEDLEYKIPMIKAANNVSKVPVFYFGSPWSAPAWMKTNNQTTGLGGLIGSPGGRHYSTWAKYFLKFYEEYEKLGVNIWGFTIQNEPTTGYIPWRWQTMSMSPFTERDFIRFDLGPTLFNKTNGHIKLMILDDNRIVLPLWADIIFNDPDGYKFVAGIAVHWYGNNFRDAEVLDRMYKAYPGKFILNSEACSGFQPWAKAVILGSWDRAEEYAFGIIDDMRHSVGGWIDWNLCLDVNGGPNWKNNFVDATVIVDESQQTFYKQPTYYAMAHFTKFVPRGSFRINDKVIKIESDITSVSFKRSDGRLVSVVLNANNEGKKVQIIDYNERIINLEVPPRSLSSVIWQ